MCGYSKTTIGNKEIGMYVGWYGGNIEIGHGKDRLKFEQDDEKKINREAIKKIIMQHKKEEIAEMIMKLVENSDEG